MDGDDDNPRDGEEGGEVVPFPGGRHPSQWPGDRPPDSDDGSATTLPFDDGQAAGEYESLPEQSHTGHTYDLDARRRDDRADEPGHPPETSDDAETDESAEAHDKLIDVVDDDEEFEDFVTGDSSFDEFTRDDYIRATTQEYQGLADAIAEAATEQIEMQAVAAAMPGIESGLVGFEDVTGEEPVMVAPVIQG
ncbi:MAG: hypothetical protein MUP13_01665, partial [Thermoanaerobaculales bacterium]|nr:hypothetical protein [Thermoanaerobaculales bacterium]